MMNKRLLYFVSVALLILVALPAVSQTKIRVKGKVVDEATKSAIEGANIATVKGNTILGTTMADGTFSVLVEPKSQVVISHVLYEAYRTSLNDTAEVYIEMKDKVSNKSDAVVVTGFTQKNKDLLTGSAVRVSGDVVRGVPASSFVDLLQGRAAGLNIQNNTGSPGGVGTINLRGTSQMNISSDGFLTPASPLFIIDGIPVDINSNYTYNNNVGANNVNPLSLIPPDDIESFDILKDAAAMSLYGSRAANGVIIVTTRRGRSQVPTVNYTADLFFNTPPKLLKTIGGIEERNIRINTMLKYDTLYNEALKARVNGYGFLTDSLNPYYNNSTNWQDIFYRPTTNHQHNILVSGGNMAFNYKINGGYQSNKGIIKNTDFERYSINLQGGYNPSEKFRVLASIGAAYGIRGNGTSVTGSQTGVANSAATSSLLPPPTLYDVNSVAAGADNKNNQNRANSYQGNLDVQYMIIKGLNVNNSFSYNYATDNNNLFIPSSLSGSAADIRFYDRKRYTLNNRARLTYNQEIGEHSFQGFVFNEINSYGDRQFNVRLAGTANDQIKGPLGYQWASSQGAIQPGSDTRQLGYGGELFYNYARRYVLTLSYRMDLNSTNGPSQGYVHQPSISGRWNFSREKFLSDTKWLSDGALRGSWGKVTTPVGDIFNVYGKYIVGSPYNNNPTVYLDYASIPNSSLTPQIVTNLNAALDLGLFNNRVRLTIEAYYKATDNQLITIPLNTSTAFNSYVLNGGSVVNRGIEFTGDFTIVNQKDFRIFLNTNFALDRGTLTRLPDGLRERTIDFPDASSNIPVLQRIGSRPFANVMYINKGVYATNDDVPVNPNTGLRLRYGSTGNVFFKAGDPAWVDINGDYVIDEKDLVPLGNPIPLLNGGFNPTVQYKNFQLFVSFVFTLKRDIINEVLANRLDAYTNPTSLGSLQDISSYNYWKPNTSDLSSGTVGAVYPNPFDYTRAGTIAPFRTNQSLYLEDGSYVKLNSLRLAYTVAKNLVERYGINNLQLRASMSNVFTLSKYSGINPETVSSLGRDISGGYPNPRMFSLGLGLTF